MIPKGAKNPDAAHKWIDFVYEPRIAALEMLVHLLRLAGQAPAAQGQAREEHLHQPGSVPDAEDRGEPRSERLREGNAIARAHLDRVQGVLNWRSAPRGREPARAGHAPAPAAPLSGVARAAGACWYLLFFLGPLGDHGHLQLRRDLGVLRRRVRLEPRELPLPVRRPLYTDVFKKTFVMATFGTSATLLIGFPFAYYLARYAKHKTLLLLLVIVPFWTSFLIRTYSFLIILDPEFPLFRALGRSGSRRASSSSIRRRRSTSGSSTTTCR